MKYCTFNYISISSIPLFIARMQKFVSDSKLVYGALKTIGSIVYELDTDKIQVGFLVCLFIIRNSL